MLLNIYWHILYNLLRETKANRSSQIKEEFVKYCDLIPYEIVTFEVNFKIYFIIKRLFQFYYY